MDRIAKATDDEVLALAALPTDDPFRGRSDFQWAWLDDDTFALVAIPRGEDYEAMAQSVLARANNDNDRNSA